MKRAIYIFSSVRVFYLCHLAFLLHVFRIRSSDNTSTTSLTLHPRSLMSAVPKMERLQGCLPRSISSAGLCAASLSSSTTATTVAKRYGGFDWQESLFRTIGSAVTPIRDARAEKSEAEDADVWWERVARTPRNHRRPMILECRPANSDWYEDVRRLIDNTLVDIAAMFASRSGKRKRSRGCLSIDRVGRCLRSGITSLYLRASNALFNAFERKLIARIYIAR